MTTETTTLGAGCFWCIEAIFDGLAGVESVESGYIGGHVVDPTYREVCGGATGHAEAARIVFDPAIVTFDEILDIFFEIHDPTQLNRQGNDVGTQYRSAIFVGNPAEKGAAQAALRDAGVQLKKPIATLLLPATAFWPAEGYHQDFFAKNPGQGYCMAVAQPKVNKVRKSYAKYVIAA